ncbi:MAG TPA: hypothetical protein VNG71_10430, partial [Pyrinomonadaceae bacterium]|nr:hypothetical protein [Pyrinomonadaceae bacterium]
GVDDFTQEFAYLSGRDQWMMRDLIGYGTARGLKVSAEEDSVKGPRVVVEPGVAVSPGGQMICVPTAQCAYLKNWVADHGAEISAAVGSPIASSVTVYVVLCYRDCTVDNVPIAGEPCRSEDQLMAPSRIKDDFCLQLRLQKPNQREEDAIRDFVAWLRQVPVSEFGASTPLDDFLNAIRDAAAAWFASPPASPITSPPTDFMFGSPPLFMHIDAMDLCKYTAAAFRLWVTELRPKWIARWHGCAPQHFGNDASADEDCVLLAQLDVPVTPTSPGGWDVPNVTITVNDSARPYLVHQRMLQDWLICAIRPHAARQMKVRKLKALAGGSTFNVNDRDEFLICDSDDGQLTIKLPPASRSPGRLLVIKKLTGTRLITISPTNPDVIDGSGTAPTFAANSKFRCLQLVAATNGDWSIISSL